MACFKIFKVARDKQYISRVVLVKRTFDEYALLPALLFVMARGYVLDEFIDCFNDTAVCFAVA